MSDENDEPKNDDWSMTMPHLRPEKDAAEDDFFENFAALANRPPPAADDEWAMTEPNQPNDYSNADFDRTVPNLKIPHDDWEHTMPPPLKSLPAEDREKPAPASDGKTESWEMNAPPNAAPPNNAPPSASGKNRWSMPAPVFRVSDGENIEDIKKTAAFRLSDLQDFDEQTKDFKPSPPPASSASNFDFQSQPPPNFADHYAAGNAPPPLPSAAAPPRRASKTPYIIGGIAAMFVAAGVFLAGIYLVFIRQSVNAASSSSAASVQSESAAMPAPLTAAPPAEPAINLPNKIEDHGAMVLIAAGAFTMGSNRDADDAKPAHEVVLPAYYIDRTEVTNAEYKKFCDATGKPYPVDPHIEKNYFAARPNAPVVGVSFADAQAYADWAGKRLPTEEEWEKAASWDAATGTKHEFPWGDDFRKSNAAFETKKIADVGQFSGGASPSGALDMAGNVLEWVDAYFQPYPNGARSNPEFGEINRVVRGGHFASKSADSLKTTKRIYIPPTVASGEDDEKLVAAIIGFRCAVSADDSRLAAILANGGK